MGKSKDLTGQKFGRLTAIKPVGKSKSHNILWLCKCDCGNYHTTAAVYLNNGDCKSCGCLKRQMAKDRTTKHGKKGTRIYIIWQNIKRRCTNPNNPNYKDYGGRGISYCSEWEEFEPFYEWAIKNGYKDDLTIDRIDVNGNYCPNNCRWVTQEQQQYNKRTTHYLTYKGETKSMAEWAKIKNINIQTLASRINLLKWSVEKALETLPYTAKGEN